VPSLNIVFSSYLIENPEWPCGTLSNMAGASEKFKSSVSIQPLEASMFIAVWLPYQVKNRKGTQKY
jgi:hypothetical protein